MAHLILKLYFVPLPSDSSAGNDILTKATVPIYATGVLTCYNQVKNKKGTRQPNSSRQETPS